jgi:hypothetical protein
MPDALRNHRWPSRPGQPQFDWEPPRCVESRVGGTADGLPYRVDRIKALGNSVVPQAAREAFIRLFCFCPNASKKTHPPIPRRPNEIE